VKNAASKATCASNLRQLGLSVICYAGEQDGFLPCSLITANAPAWSLPLVYHGFAGPFTAAAWSDAAFVGQYLDALEAQGGCIGRTGTVRARGVWQCPADAGRPFFAQARPYNIDYGMNTYLSPDFDAATWQSSLRLGQIQRSASMLLLGETRHCRWKPTETALPTVAIHDPAKVPSWLVLPYPSSLVGRHGMAANFCAVDGHVQAVRDLTAAVADHSLLVHNSWGL
jgi:prepilin-type processing-associated H-X9-DG protein